MTRRYGSLDGKKGNKGNWGIMVFSLLFFYVFNFWSYMLEAWLCKPLCRWVVFPCITPLLRLGAPSWCLSAAAAPGHCWQLVEISEYWYKTGGLSVISDGAWESIVSDTSKGVTCFDRISWIYSNRLVRRQILSFNEEVPWELLPSG